MNASKEIAEPGVPARAPRALGHLLRFDRQLQRVEVGLLAASLLVMVGLAFAQVLMRTFRTELIQPVSWFDNVARHLVIWVGMLGASLCTAEGRHISIEALPKLFGPGGRRRTDVIVSLASIAVVSVLFVLSMIYMLRVQVPDPAHLLHCRPQARPGHGPRNVWGRECPKCRSASPACGSARPMRGR